MLLTTHYMDEAEQLCDRVAIIDHGKVIALGTPAELIARTRRRARGRASRCAVISDVAAVRRCPAWWRRAPSPRASRSPCASRIAPCRRCSPSWPAQGAELASLTTHHATLEDVFVSLTGQQAARRMMLERSALWQLTYARMMGFLREPEALFWVFAFPLLLALALGIAFRSSGPQKSNVGVVIGADADRRRRRRSARRRI